MQRRTDYENTQGAEFLLPLLRDAIATALDEQLARSTPLRLVLDVGSGNQPLRSRIESAGWVYRSLDLAQNDTSSVDFLAPIDGELPPALLDTRFDLVVCTEVLEHVADWPKAFTNLGRLTAPGSTVLITCPHFFPLHEEPHDYWRPTLHALRHHAERAGFRVVVARSVGEPMDVLGTLLESVRPASVTGSPTAYVLRKITTLILRVLKSILLAAPYRRRVSLSGLFYLTNVVVLERQ